jgi:hypothetical protein
MDQDYDLMGLSKHGNNPNDDDSFLMDRGISLEPHEDHNFDFVKEEEGLKMPFQPVMEYGFAAE